MPVPPATTQNLILLHVQIDGCSNLVPPPTPHPSGMIPAYARLTHTNARLLYSVQPKLNTAVAHITERRHMRHGARKEVQCLFLPPRRNIYAAVEISAMASVMPCHPPSPALVG